MGRQQRLLSEVTLDRDVLVARVSKRARADGDTDAREGDWDRADDDEAHIFNRSVVHGVDLAALEVHAVAAVEGRVGPQITTRAVGLMSQGAARHHAIERYALHFVLGVHLEGVG